MSDHSSEPVAIPAATREGPPEAAHQDSMHSVGSADPSELADEVGELVQLHRSKSNRKTTSEERLFMAVGKGNLKKLKQLIGSRVNVNVQHHNDHRTALHMAALEGHIKCIATLIAAKADVARTDKNGVCPLYVSIVSNQDQATKVLSDAGAVLSPEGKTLIGQRLENCCATGNVEEAKRLIACKADVDTAQKDGRTVLHVAVSCGQMEIVELLLSCGANTNLVNRWGKKALNDAQSAGNDEIADAIERRSSSGALADEGDPNSMFLAAVAKGDKENAVQYISDGGNVDYSREYDRRTALHLAAAEGHLDIVKILMDAGANVKSKDRWNFEPMRDAVRGNHTEIAEILRRAGGSDRSRKASSSGHSVHDSRNSSTEFEDSDSRGDVVGLCGSASDGELALVKEYVEANTDVNGCSHYGRTALHVAAAGGHVQVVEYLLEVKANVLAKDTSNLPPLADALKGGHKEVAELLLRGYDEDKREAVKNNLVAEIAAMERSNSDIRLRAKMEQWYIDKDELKLGEILGEGEQGEVRRSWWRGLPVVAKVVKHSGGLNELDFWNEMALLSSLRHPNLVLFLGAVVDGSTNIIMSEWMEGTSLNNYYAKHIKEDPAWQPPIKSVLMWAKELGQALSFLHQNNPPVIHRDLKPGNVLISAENHVKLGDFGLGKTFNRNQVLTGHWKMTGNTGTIRYMAPEVKRFLPYDERVDIYSFGLLTWYMATAKLPFGDIKTRWLWKDLDGCEYESYWAKYSADELSPEHHCVEGEPWRGRSSGLGQGGEGLTEPLSFLKSSFSRMSSDSKHAEASSMWASPSKGVPMDSTSPKQKAITKVQNGLVRPSLDLVRHRSLAVLLERCWHPKPRERPSAAMCVKRLTEIEAAESASKVCVVQ